MCSACCWSTVTLLTAACILLPLVLLGAAERDFSRRRRRTSCYFAAIGFGFMLVEISQVQRLTIFLGHPVYSLSVVLFSLLLSSGVGQPFDRRAFADGGSGQPRD